MRSSRKLEYHEPRHERGRRREMGAGSLQIRACLPQLDPPVAVLRGVALVEVEPSGR